MSNNNQNVMVKWLHVALVAKGTAFPLFSGTFMYILKLSGLGQAEGKDV